MEIKIEELLTLLKARGVIGENTSILIYRKQAIAVPLNREDELALLPASLEKPWIYQLLPFIVNSGYFTEQE